MPALGALLQKLFGNSAKFFGNMFDSSVALRLAIVAAIVALAATFYAAVNALFAGVSSAMPSVITIPASWIMPTNMEACLSAVLAAHAAAALYSFQRDYLVQHQPG